MHKHIRRLPVPLNKLETFFEAVQYREVLFIVGVDFLVEGDLLGWVGDGWVR